MHGAGPAKNSGFHKSAAQGLHEPHLAVMSHMWRMRPASQSKRDSSYRAAAENVMPEYSLILN